MRMIVSSVLACAALALFGAIAAHTGFYGWGLFVVAPLALGALTTVIHRPETRGEAACVSAFASVLALLGFFALGIEGAICIVMAAPLAIPVAMLGGLMAYAFIGPSRRGAAAAMCLLLPPLFSTAEAALSLKPALREVRTTIDIEAPPERVWPNVVAFSELAPPTEWYFQSGIAYPMRARIDGRGPGAVRYCDFSTGPFVEPIQVWDENHRLAFRVTASPRPMHEWSPYAGIAPRHLDGYFVSERGQFTLTRRPDGGTRLEGTTWYRNHLWPSSYWRLWSDAIIHRIHLRVLTHIRQSSRL